MTDMIATLEAIGIVPAVHHHPPVLTVDDARGHWAAIDAAHTKNLFLKDSKGAWWLIVTGADRPLDMKALAPRIGSGRLRFAAADDLERMLGVGTGAVSALAIVNDRDQQVTLVIDAALMAAPRIAMHPLDNRQTIVMAPDDLARFLSSIGRAARVLPL